MEKNPWVDVDVDVLKRPQTLLGRGALYIKKKKKKHLEGDQTKCLPVTFRMSDDISSLPIK